MTRWSRWRRKGRALYLQLRGAQATVATLEQQIAVAQQS